MSDSPRTEIPPDMPLSVTLPAQQWLLMQQMLGEAPYRLAAPLIAAIQQQCMAGAERRAEPEPEYMPRRTNGSVASAGASP